MVRGGGGDALASAARSQQDDLCEVVIHATQLLSPRQQVPSDKQMFRTYSRRLLAAPTGCIAFVPGPAHGRLDSRGCVPGRNVAQRGRVR